jgi:hypothetical protein
VSLPAQIQNRNGIGLSKSNSLVRRVNRPLGTPFLYFRRQK